MNKVGKLLKISNLLFYTFSITAIVGKSLISLISNSNLFQTYIRIVRVLYFADAFKFFTYPWQIFLFLYSFPLYTVLTALLAYELQVLDLVFSLHHAQDKLLKYSKLCIYSFIFLILAIYLLLYTTKVIKNQKEYHLNQIYIASLYFITGVAIVVAFIHFVCEMKRSFGHHGFESVIKNVRMIYIVIIVSFLYNCVALCVSMKWTRAQNLRMFMIIDDL